MEEGKLKYLGLGIIYVIIYQIAVELSANTFLIRGNSDEIVRLFFLAPAVSLSFIIIFGSKYIPFLAINPLYNTINNGRPLFLVITLVLALPIVYGGAGYFLRQKLGFNPSEFTLREITKLVVVVSIAPLLNACFIQISFLLNSRITLDQLLPRVVEWYVGDLIGIFTLLPLILYFYQAYKLQIWENFSTSTKLFSHLKHFILTLSNFIGVFLVFFLLINYNINMAYLLFLPIAILAIVTNPGFTILVTSFNSFLLAYLLAIANFQVNVIEIQGYIVSSIFFALFISSTINDKRISDIKLKKEEEKRLENSKFVALGKLAQGISHDLNNALTVLSGRIQLLEANQELSSDHLEPLVVSTQLIYDLNNQLQSISQFRRLNKEKLDLNDILLTMSKTLKNMVNEKVNIQIQTDDNLPEILANRNQIERVIMNLVVNAIEAIQEDGSIILNTFTRDGNTYLSIQDTGIGIDKHHQENIYEMLITTKKNNSGLGLWIVKQILSEINAEIWFDSLEGKGTTFFIKF